MEHLEAVSREDYERYRLRRFGSTNPERMDNPLWEAAVRCQWGAYHIADFFDPDIGYSKRPTPIWTFDRLGMSRTFLDEGLTTGRRNSVLYIAGEHEDFYDPDFCIYNDVIVCHQGGSVEIYGYPPSVFPP